VMIAKVPKPTLHVVFPLRVFAVLKRFIWKFYFLCYVIWCCFNSPKFELKSHWTAKSHSEIGRVNAAFTGD
jgi:hypothetical protein